MELVTIVFMLSLRALKNFIAKQKIKIDADGAQQLAVDIKYIVESICTSDLLKQNDLNFQIQFKQKLLGLHELKKWKRMIQILIETHLDLNSQSSNLSIINQSATSSVVDDADKKSAQNQKIISEQPEIGDNKLVHPKDT